MDGTAPPPAAEPKLWLNACHSTFVTSLFVTYYTAKLHTPIKHCRVLVVPWAYTCGCCCMHAASASISWCSAQVYLPATRVAIVVLAIHVTCQPLPAASLLSARASVPAWAAASRLLGQQHVLLLHPAALAAGLLVPCGALQQTSRCGSSRQNCCIEAQQGRQQVQPTAQQLQSVKLSVRHAVVCNGLNMGC